MSASKLSTPIGSSKYLSKSSESLSNIDDKVDVSTPQKPINASSDKPTKMKKSQTALNGFEGKIAPSSTSTINSTSMLRRRFSLFRIKRSQPTNTTTPTPPISTDNNTNVQALQQIIDQLRRDLQMKTDELETIKQRIEKKRSSIAVPTNESIEQAMQLQTMLNSRLEEMLVENDLLKKSIHELESYAQHQQKQQQQQQQQRGK